MMKSLSTVLVASLILSAPGLPFYQAAAQTVSGAAVEGAGVEIPQAISAPPLSVSETTLGTQEISLGGSFSAPAPAIHAPDASAPSARTTPTLRSTPLAVTTLNAARPVSGSPAPAARRDALSPIVQLQGLGENISAENGRAGPSPRADIDSLGSLDESYSGSRKGRAGLPDDAVTAAEADPALATPAPQLSRPGRNIPPDGALPPYLTDLTQQARNGELQPIYLRDKEIDQTVQVLNQAAYNNVFLIGETGVGKTAIAEGLAQRIARRQTGTPLDDQRVVLLEVGKFLAAAGASPDLFAQAVEDLLEHAADGKTVLVIDEAHQLARDPNLPALQASLFDQLKPAMTKGRLKLILATTRDEHTRFFSQDRALESRSQIIQVEPVKEGPAIELLWRPAVRSRFENDVKVARSAVDAAVRLTVRAFRFDALLRMAIKALDNAATRVRIRPGQAKIRLLTARRELLYHLDLLRQAREAKDLEWQESLIPQVAGLLETAVKAEGEFSRPSGAEVSRADVAEALAELGAPVNALQGGSPEFVAGVERTLRDNLIAHPELIDKTIEAIKRRYSQPDVRKPIFSALLLGPTGTGKTEFLRLLGKAFFGVDDVEKSVIKLNGGDLMEKHQIATLIGSPPGYKDSGETETLLDKIRRKPQSIILIDEAEKLHPDILNFFLSILEDASAKDARGKPADFSNTIVAFTSNYGIPEGYETLDDAAFRSHVEGVLKAGGSRFRPEFLNRLDHAEIFVTLKPEEARAIVELRLAQLEGRWRREHGVRVAFADRAAAAASLLERGYSRRDGARAINRVINDAVETPLSNALFEHKLGRGDLAEFAADGSLSIRPAPAEEKTPRLPAVGPDGGALAARLEALLGRGEPLTLDRVDEALAEQVPAGEFSHFRPRTSFEGFSPSDASEPLRQHTPQRADPALDAALGKLKGALPAGQAEAAVQGVKALALKAKRLNLEAAMRAIDGPSWERGFTETEQAAMVSGATGRDALQAKLGEAVQTANRERSTVLSWSLAESRLRVAAETDSPLPVEEEVKLRETLGEGVTADVTRDGPLIDLRNALMAAGGAAGYEKEAGKTRLWIDWPLEEAPAATDSAAPAAALPREEPPTAEVVEEVAQPPAVAVETSGPHGWEPASLNAFAPNVGPLAAVGPRAAVQAMDHASPIAALPREEPLVAEVVKAPIPAAELAALAADMLDPSRSAETVYEDARRLDAAISADPAAATADLERTLRGAIEAYTNLLSQRKAWNDGSGYYGYGWSITRLNAEDASLLNGRHVPTRRVRDLLALHHGLIAARPDLADENTAGVLSRAFQAPVVVHGGDQTDDTGDEVVASALLTLAGTVRALSSKRPELMTLQRLAAIYETMAKVPARAHRGKLSWKITPLESTMTELTGELLNELRSRLLAAPAAEARSVLAQFDVDEEKWRARPSFEAVLDEILHARPQMRAALSAKPGEPIPEAGAAAETPTEAAAVVEAPLPAVEPADDLIASAGRQPGAWAASGQLARSWESYKGAYDRKKALYAPAVSSPKAFYIRLFGLGQLFLTKTALGPRISTDLVETTARELLDEYFEAAGTKTKSSFERFLERAREVDAASPNRLRKRVLAALAQASLLPAGELGRFFDSQVSPRYILEVEEFRRGRRDAVLSAFSEEALAILGREDAATPLKNVAGVIVTGSYVYGSPLPDSDLDVYILTRDGTDRDSRAFVELLERRRGDRWPKPKDLENHSNVLRADGDEALRMVRQFQSVVLARDPELAARFDGVTDSEPFYRPTKREAARSRLVAPFFRLLARLRLIFR